MKSLLVQIIAFIAIFQLISWFKTSSMLSGHQIKEVQAFILPTIHDELVDLKATKAKTIVYFFAPWCEICHASIGNLQAIYEKNDEIDVIAVALDYGDKSDVLAFTAKHQLTFPVAYGDEKVKKSFKIQGYPSYYVLDEKNEIQAKSIGYSTEVGLLLRSL